MICQKSSNSIFNIAPQFLAAHDTMRFLSGLLFLVIPLQEVPAQQTVRVNKCCPMGQIFKSSEKSCVQSSGIRLRLAKLFHPLYFFIKFCLHLETSIIGRTINVTDKTIPDAITKDSVNPLKNLNLIQGTLELKNITKPACVGRSLHYETHRITPGFTKHISTEIRT